MRVSNRIPPSELRPGAADPAKRRNLLGSYRTIVNNDNKYHTVVNNITAPQRGVWEGGSRKQVTSSAQPLPSRLWGRHVLATPPSWRDAVHGARWGLEYLDILRDLWASELTSPRYLMRENVKMCSGWEVQTSSRSMLFWVVWPTLHGSHCSSPTGSQYS